MLHDPRVKIGRLAFHCLAVRRVAAINDARIAGHRAGHAGNRQAAFPAHGELIVERLEFRVDQCGQGREITIRGVLFATFTGRFENDHAFAFIDLRRGQSDTRRILHGLDHIFEQTADIARGWIGDFLRRFEQNRVSHAGNF